MTQKPKRTVKGPSFLGKVLLAAVIVSLLAVTASAAESGWFVRFFSPEGGIPLSDSQIQLLEEKEQPIQEVQTQAGWTVELRSAMNDGTIGYIILGVTAPEGVNLEEEVRSDTVVSQVVLQNHSLREDGEGKLAGGPDVIRWPQGVQPCSYSMQWSEDGDGRENTHNYVIELYPDFNRCQVDPFGPEAEWGIFVEGFVRESRNDAYYQELMSGKYKGQTDVMFTHEETLALTIREVLTDHPWEFTFSFAKSEEGIELLTEPVEILAEVGFQEPVRRPVKLTSMRLTPFTLTMYHQETSLVQFSYDDQAIAAVMKDGSKIYLVESHSSDGCLLLEAGYPMVPEEVDYIQFRDGTKIPMPD